ncbi:hypothetical protein [Paenibacillus flagellatus]|uniref:Uncharacterized protein n=1 Tax=Paenibacillus flagellatus TaxID=2211139 RepID=A0A2V5K893_9BACL|nr:hypothetical protein [Paenibacillus flagellatus]PYI55588.1 hypothetical protein DLM86_07600 [Paenibacillus flagellatus]
MPTISVVSILVLLLAAIGATVAVGVSKENKEGNPGYESRTKGNMTRLTLFYVVTGILAVIAVVFFVTTR